MNAAENVVKGTVDKLDKILLLF